MIVGQVVKIKPQFCEPGDEDALYVVRTSDEPGKPRVDISSLDLLGWPLWPMSVIRTDMLITTEFALDMRTRLDILKGEKNVQSSN